MPHVRFALAVAVLVLASLPAAARAQVYKCTPAGGGHVIYQSTPCPVPGKPAAHPTAAQLNAERASNPAPARPPVAADDPYDDGHRRHDCTMALKNQSVLKSPGRVVYTDALGHRVEVMDSERPALVAQAERQAKQFCD